VKIVVCLYTLEVGGSQINAIEIAAAVARAGHEVIIYGPDGDLRPMVRDADLEFVEGPARDRPRLSARATRQIADLTRRRKIDVIHSYESIPAMDAAIGSHLWRGTPLVTTVLSMSVPKYLPTHVPLIVGTQEIVDREGGRRAWVELMEPPVDTGANAPIADNAAARARFGLAPSDCAVVSISRLVPSLKLEGILAAARAVRQIGAEYQDLRLLIVGDGEARDLVERAAEETNAALGRTAVSLVGQLLDPRDAYAAADIVIGMGGSALRAMAFAKPLIVQGECGFWLPLTPKTLDVFLEQGWYGTGGGDDGAPRVAQVLRDLVRSPERRRELGAFGREVVTERFSLDVAAKRQVEIYHAVLARRTGFARRATSMAETAAHYAWFRAVWLRRLVGKARRPVAQGPGR